MKNIFTVLLVFAFSCAFGVAGDDCSTAILVSSSGCSATAAYNNTGITGTLTPPSCFTAGTNNGMWFSFVASSVNVSVTVTGTTLTTPQVAIMAPPATGCANGATFTELGCSSPGTATATVALNGALTVGNTYYIYVDGQNNVVGTFQVCLTSPQQPTNDAPCNAITPPSITNWCSPSGAYTTLGSTPDLNPAPTCFSSTTPNTVWFQFTPTQIAGTITIDGGTGGIVPEVAIVQFVGGCSGASYSTVVCGAAAAGQTSVTISTNFLAPGVTYYIVVSAEAGDGPFSICINNYPITSTVPNDQCPGAIPICPGQNYSGTTAGATSTNDIPILDNNGNQIWNCNGIINNVVWYTFVATTPPQNAVFNVNWDSYGVDGYPGGAIQFEVFNYTGPGTACAHSGSSVPGYWTSLTSTAYLPCEGASTGPGTEIIPAASLVAGRTYYLLIDNFPNDTVTYNFTGTGIAGTTAGSDTIICAHSASFNQSGASPTGGTWSGPGITNASLGTFNPMSLTTGVYTIYYTANGCTDAKQITIEGPTVNTSADVSICQGSSATLDGNITEYPGTAPVTFTNSTTYSVTGGGSASSVIPVSGINPNTVATNPILSVCIDVGAEYADDDKITLKCPGGTTITLVPYTNSGGTLLSGFSGTCFTTGSPTISGGTPPYSGSFAPYQPFTNLNACLVDGNWTLKVTNNSLFDLTGAIADWSITFLNTIPNPTYVWSPTTNMTNSTTLSPTVAPTATTSYILTATDTLGCVGKDTVKVTVTPKPNAGPDQNLTCITLPGTATMAATGTGTWTALTGNPATTPITTPSSPTTTITGFTVAGTYYYEWGSGSCNDTAAVIVTAKPNAGPDQTVTCYPTNSSATMAGTGTGTWTAQTGNPGTATISIPTSPTTTITNYSAPGTYHFIWTNGTCTDTAAVVVTTKPNAGPDEAVTCATLPGGSATMAATGIGTWTAQAGNPGTAIITNTTLPTTTITTYTVAGTYRFIWTNGACTDTAAVVVTAKPNAGPDQTVTCYPANSSATMAGTGTGTWTAQTGNPGTATISIPTSPTTTITNYSAPGTYHFIWTNGTCTDTAAVVVTTKPNAGPDQAVTCAVLPGGSATMAASGTGTWTAQAGNPGTAVITTATSPTTTITTYSAAGTYYFIWTSGACSDTAAVVVTAKPNAGPDQTVTCYPVNTTATMAATGTGTWTAQTGNPGTATITTPGSPTTTITGISAAGTYYFIWTTGTCSDTAAVIVTAKPNAGVDQAVSCAVLPGGIATMAGTGTGTWTARAGNPGTAPTITNPTSPTTTISPFTVAGTYYYIWTSGSCSDTAAIVVTAKPNAGPDQTVTCATLPGGSATMAGTGTGTWTAQTGNPGTAIITAITSPTTTITTYSAAGTYHFIWTNGTCSDTAAIVVTAKPNAGPDQAVSCYPINTTATMAGTGTGTWTPQSGNPGTATITTPTSATTTISAFSTAGTYYFIFTNGACSDTAAVAVTTKPNAGPDQTVSCAVLPGGIANMAAAGTGTWTAQAGNPGSAVITTPSSPTTSITTYSVAGTYYFIWTNGVCADTAAVVVTAKPNAGLDQTTCQYTSATISATGTGVWTAQAGNPSTATITTPASATTTVTGLTVAGAYSFIWTVNGCADTTVVNVTAKPNAGTDQTICQYTSATMAATGTGIWTAQAGNPTPAPTITTPTSSTTSITGFATAGAYNFVWTSNGCTDTMTVNVTAKPNAGTDQTICQYTSATMAATGTGIWTAQAGNPVPAPTITTPTSATTSITGFATAGAYNFVWTSNGCTDTMTVNVTAKPDAGADQQVCINTSATMAATGAGVWTIIPGNPAATAITTASSPTTSITGFTVAGTYGYVWTVNGCTDTADVIVSPDPDAGPDQVICQYTAATMAGVGSGTWTGLSTNPITDTITTPTSAVTTITGFNLPGIYHFVFTFGTCTDTMSVTVTAKPDAGTDQTICQYNDATMAATGTGTWTAQSGNPTPAPAITTPASATTSITGFATAGAYNFVWTSNGCTDTMTVNVTAKPDAGPDQSVCQYTAATMAATGTGTWTDVITNPSATVIASATDPATTISGFDQPGAYSFVWTVNGCTDTVVVNIIAKPVAGTDQTICQYTSTNLSATGAGTWTDIPATNPTATVIASTTDPGTNITGFDQPGAYSFVWTVAGCTDTVIINVTPKPDAGPDQTICLNAIATMSAVGSGTWSDVNTNPVTTVIASSTDPATTISGFTVSGVYNFVWTVNGCTDTMTVNVSPAPDAGPDQNICQNTTVTMAGVGTGVWTDLSTNPTTTAIIAPTQSGTSISGFTGVGIYGFVWTVNGCTDTMYVYVAPQPTVSVADSTICSGDSTTMIALAVPSGGSYLWSDGEITSSIRVSPAANTPYSVTYTLGICIAQATGNVTVNALPVVNVTTTPTICTASNGVAEANVTGNSPYTYSWGSPGSTDTITGLATGPYTVIVTDVNGCTATATGAVGNISSTIPVNLVSLHDLKCNNDNTGSINIAALDSGTIGYLWSTQASTQNVANLAAGTYQVTATDQFGCTGTATYTLSQPAPLVLGTPTFVNPLCHGGNNGTATDIASGGSGSYYYAWNTVPQQNTQQATGLSAATYIVTVTDDSSCTATASVTLTDPPSMTFAVPIVTNTHCFGSNDGTAQIVPQGGAGGYRYLWSDRAQQTTNPAVGLSEGTYTVTVTDANGCTATTTATVGQPPATSVSATPTDLTCFQNNSGSAIAAASGGTPPYLYVWNNGDSAAQINNLQATTYTVTSTDANNCTATASTTLNQPTQITVSGSAVSTNCPTSTDGSITATATGGTGTYTYAIEDVTGNIIQSNSSGTFTGLGPNVFTIVATDQNGCNATTVITVPSPPFNVYSASADSTSCYGAQYTDGRIHLQGFTIANGPFQFSVDSGQLQYTPDFYNLAAGAHTVKIVDAHGCDTVFTVIVGAPLPASVDILPGDSTIVLGSNLQLSTVFGPYDQDSIKAYAWSPGEGLSCIDCPGPVVSPYGSQNVYTVTVTYNQGCIATAVVRINVAGDPPVYIPNAFTPNGDGTNDVLYVYGEGIKTVKMMIFDRWGEKVFESDNQSVGWDGTFRGQQESPGVYVYIADMIYLNDHTKHKEGSITLIR